MRAIERAGIPAIQKAATPAADRAAARPRSFGFAVEVDRLEPAEWDRMVAGFADASLDQTAAYSDARWGPGRISELVLRRDGIVVAAARVVVLAVPGLPLGLARVKYGPIWRRSDQADPEVLAAALDALVAEYSGRRGLHLSILPRPSPATTATEAEALAAAGFSRRPEADDPNRYLVAIDPDRARARASLAQKWRYNLRKAEANGLAVGFADDAEGIAAFRRMHAAMVSRKSASEGDAVHLLPRLAGLPKAIRPRCVLARHEGRPVAGAVVMPAGDTAYYLYGASEDAALPLNAGYALHWWILDWLATTKARFYDLGGEVGTAGLRQFKKGMVGRDGTVLAMPGAFEHSRNPVSRLLVAGLVRGRAGLAAVRGRRGTPAAEA